MPSMGNAHALIVGVSAYRPQLRALPAAVCADAEAVYQALVDPAVGAYDPGNVRLLLDEQATAAALRAALADLARVADDRTTVFVYFSGHGGRLEIGSAAGDYLLPVDTAYPDEAALAATALSAAEFTAALRAVRARKLVVVLDCCHAGGIGEAKDFKGGLSGGTLEQLQAGLGRVVLAASRGAEASWVQPGGAHSVFTGHLLAGLRGGVPAPDGLVRVFDLFHYLQPRVTADQPNQHPVLKAEVEENFPIALSLGGQTGAAAAAAPAADGYRFDVFLTYRDREPDRSWARKVLLPRLEAQGVRVCIDHRDFRLGQPRIKATEEAVQASRYTLSVLTAAYLESQLAELGGLLAEYLGAESNQSRWLGVLREPCVPRLNLRSRMLLDMTDDDDLHTNVARLSYEVKHPTVQGHVNELEMGGAESAIGPALARPSGEARATKLSGADLEAFQNAILGAYDKPTLEQLLRIKMEVHLDQVVQDRPFSTVVFDLLKYLERTDRLLEFLRAAREGNPTNTTLRKVLDELEEQLRAGSQPVPRG